MEERIRGGAPVAPALGPIGASAIAGVIAEDGDWTRLFLQRFGIEDELSATLRGGRRIVRGHLLGLLGGVHWTTDLDRKSSKVRAREQSTAPAMRSDSDEVLGCSTE
jgi:hypothetical protein